VYTDAWYAQNEMTFSRAAPAKAWVDSCLRKKGWTLLD
jgi:hypothetical protein